MLRVDTRVKKSAIQGKGLFAAQDIPEGTVVWEYDAKVDLQLPMKFLKGLSPEVLAFLDTYGSREGNIVSISLDDARFMNHSREPNLKTGPGRESMYAARGIKKGEELLCDYREFDDPSRAGEEPYV
jgi:SET domain-containing protein